MISSATLTQGFPMPASGPRRAVHAVGIDLGTTYSCLAYLNPEGKPVTLPNAEGELATPSVVLFDQDEAIVGTEALRRSVAAPECVVSHAKRYMGDRRKCWVFDRRTFRPRDISALILRKLLDAARERLGPIPHAVITVPAQFSELQRQDTVEAGLAAGLERVDIINEPVAAALCYVLSEGMWFAELANEQTILVFDLGGGTFDLSLVKYNQQQVRVIASGGDLKLGGLDWNRTLEEFLCDEFTKESISDPRLDRESMQALALEVEQLKRSLSVRPRSTAVVQHDGRRKVYAVDREHFELLTRPLVARTENITAGMLKAHGLGWAHVDAVLATGGASRMPMIRGMLSRLSGTTLNQSLSPDQSICHGAAYYAGMLLSGGKREKTSLDRGARTRLASFRQQSVSGRALGLLVRDRQSGERVPHFLIPANTPLPCAFRQRFGTVVPNQRRVQLYIVESGTTGSEQAVPLGECQIDQLPAGLPEDSPIEVTIRYDEQARVHVEAIDVTSGTSARTTIVRLPAVPPTQEVPAAPAAPEPATSRADNFTLMPASETAAPPAPTQAAPQAAPSRKQQPARPAAPQPPLKRQKPPQSSLEEAERPIPLCNRCGEPLGPKGQCRHCRPVAKTSSRPRPSEKKSPRPPALPREDDIPTEPLTTPPPPRPAPGVPIRKKP